MFALKLKEDARYQAAADEAGVDYDISGTICFSLTLTTEAVLAQIEQLEQGEHKAGKDRTYYTAGDTFGIEQVLQANGSAPNSVIIEQPTMALRVTADDYNSEVVPLQADETDRKREFFTELTVFRDLSEDEITILCKWFRISIYRPGQTIAEQVKG